MTPKFLALLLAAVCGAAQADDGPSIQISGFGTAALTAADSNDAQFVRTNQAAGAGTSARTGVDSNFGMQATLKMNEALSFTAQGLVRKFATDAYSASLTWAFAKYRVNEHLNLRVGRIGTPIYLVSDFINVGYANTMIRPSNEVYQQVPDNSFDGADLVYQQEIGPGTMTAQAGIGRVKIWNVGDYAVSFEPVKTLHLLYETGPYTLRFGHARAPISAAGFKNLDGLLATLRSLGLNQVAQDLQVKDTPASFTSVGLSADFGRWLLQAEYGKRKTDSLAIADTTSYYAMFGYRHGKFTPYAYYGNEKQDSPRSYPGVPAALSPFVNGAIRHGLQSTTALGLRWDFYRSAAFKMQWDRIQPRDGNGKLVNVKPGFAGPLNVFAAGIDFVF